MAYHENNGDRTVRALLTLALVCCLIAPTDLIGKRPKGPPEPAPSGTVYYLKGRDLYSVQPDGSGDTLVMVDMTNADFSGDTDASHYPHGGERWFLYMAPIVGETYPDGAPRGEVYAVSDQGEWVQSSLDDPAIQPRISSRLQWAADDTVVSWLGRRWATDGSGNPIVVEVGIYYVVLDADVAANPNPRAPSWVPIADFPVDAGCYTCPWPSNAGYGWSPDGTRVVFATETGLSVADVGDGTVVEIDNNGPAFHPRWSPDGTLIAVERDRPIGVEGVYGALEVMGADGGDRQVVVGDYCNWRNDRGRCYYHRVPEWSPDSLHLLYVYQVSSHNRVTNRLYRVALSGGDPFEITSGTNTGRRPVAWTSEP